MIRQLAFDLPGQPAFRREDFFVSPANATALAALDRADWPGAKLLLTGPPGSGKTHLARMWAAEQTAALLRGTDLAGDAVPLATLARHSAVVVDDADAVAGNRGAEAALFHLHNLITPAGRLLLTAATPVRDWGAVLPDLISRLTAAPVARLDRPDDALLSAVLVKLFADRQIAVPPPLIPYLVARMDRSIGAARDLVAALDRRALQLGRPVTRALAAEVVGDIGGADVPDTLGPG